ncbi:uncharacterized protein LOC131685250 [Topomyia yanbarensis]|uniref:uncharacterized protein LOC131685250 n=1 Tax=Topomyia yanbarensis TaxID=2498891 RepID=UPI00273A810D|nr:uncharacterized protein LOC131685250 [Topomyia yanbarensis]
MELWNKRDLAPPVLITFKCKTKHCKEDIRALCTALSTALRYFESLQSFEKAAAYVSRFSIRWNNRFYNMHGFRLLKRLNQALLRFRSVDIVRVLTDLVSMMPDVNYLEKTVDLPTRASLDFLLIRLQGLAKLFFRIVVLSKDAAKYYIRFISACYFFNLSSMFLCLLAEIWYKSRDICQQIGKFYNQLFPLRMLLADDGNEWPSKGAAALPDNLVAWMGDDWTEEIVIREDQSTVLNLRPGTDLFLLLTGEEEDLSSSRKIDARIDSKVSATKDSATSLPRTILMQNIKSDIGEVVVRQTKKPKEKQIDWRPVERLKSKFDVKKFLEEEKQKRKQDLPRALTSKVNSAAFNAFASSMMRESGKMSTGDYVRVFTEELEALVGKKKTSSKKQIKR